MLSDKIMTEKDVVRDAAGKITGYAPGVAVINNNAQPGDLKYKDQNGDGVIDSKDQVVLGHWTPDFNLGFNFTANYKRFTLFMKFASVVGDDGTMNFSTVKDLVNKSAEAGLTVYGHTLCWHSQQNITYLNSLLAPPLYYLHVHILT